MTMAKKFQKAPRASMAELLETKASLLRVLPMGYGDIETVQDAIAAAVPNPPELTLRLHIIWDCPADRLELDQALDLMRAYGAAMITKVEVVD